MTPELKREDIKIEEWEFVFESARKSMLFEDLLVYHYIPFGGSVNFYTSGNITVYERKSHLRDMAQEGSRRSLEEIVAQRAQFESSVAAAMRETPEYLSKPEFTAADAQHMCKRLDSLIAEYAYFDSFFWEDVYARKEEDSAAQKTVALLEEFKNVAKMVLVDLCFKKDSYLEILLARIAGQCSIAPETLHWYQESELSALFGGARVPDEEIARRQDAYLYYKDDSDILLYSGTEAKELITLFNPATAEQTEFKGRVAHKGRGGTVRGKVAIITRDYGDGVLMRQQMEEMAQGDILVAETTDPEVMPALRKAAAIVTDVGGMLSHASITARELDTPCIIGTGNASKILKTGDHIEVDIEKGVVRIIERA